MAEYIDKKEILRKKMEVSLSSTILFAPGVIRSRTDHPKNIAPTAGPRWMPMKIKNGKIVSATEAELQTYWMAAGYDDVMSFPDFLQKMVLCGVEIHTNERKEDE